MQFQIELPEIIRFGRGIRRELPALLPPGPVVVVCGRHARARIAGELIPALSGRVVEVIDDIAPEPTLDELERVRRAGRSIGAAALVGWGGGSAIDVAKGAAALLHAPEPASEYFYGRAAAEPRRCFFAGVPTTAGTGAELTANAVFIDAATGIKQSIRTPGMTADAAFIDPELVEEAPLPVLASAGFDALTQAVESFISRRADGLTRELSRAGAVSGWQALQRLAAGERTAEVFDGLARGSLLGGMGFSRAGLGAVHGLAHPCGSRSHLPHGVVCAILLPEVLQVNRGHSTLDELALTLTGRPDSAAFIAEVERLRQSLGLPGNFRGGLTSDDVAFILVNCRSGSMKCNPVELTDHDLTALLEKLL